MSAETVDTPIVSAAALRSVNFFNGRLLTGEDLRREQANQESRLARLARASGEGVAYGLEVQETLGSSSKGHPVVTVAAGLALSRSGLALELPTAADVSLARAAPTATSEPGGLFADCQPFAPGTYTAGAGVYLLTIGPAQQGEGRAPVSGLGNDDALCNVAVSVTTVKFHLIRLALLPADLTDKRHLRNRVAYRCFAPDALAAFVRDPFGPPPTTYGLLDALRTQTLSDDEVPLAIIAWSIDDGIQFVDLWSVRRRLTRRPAEDELAAVAGDRRRAEGEAMFLQFQAQIGELPMREDTHALAGAADFDLLPAAGLLPLADVGEAGFGFREFFAPVPTRGPVHIASAQVAALLQESFGYPPIDLGVEELVWLYVVRENLLPSAAGTQAHPYVLFASGQVRYRADARFELSYWNFSNYAEIG